MAAPGETRPETASLRNEFALERYRYILQQIHAVNENAHRFLTLYQTLATALVSAALLLFVGYQKWDVAPDTARGGVIGLLVLVKTWWRMSGDLDGLFLRALCRAWSCTPESVLAPVEQRDWSDMLHLADESLGTVPGYLLRRPSGTAK